MSASAAARQPVPLRRGVLSSLPPGIRAPGYDVSAVRPGIVHLGLGGFHRAHMARYTHELMERDPQALGWGIVGAVLLPSASSTASPRRMGSTRWSSAKA